MFMNTHMICEVMYLHHIVWVQCGLSHKRGANSWLALVENEGAYVDHLSFQNITRNKHSKIFHQLFQYVSCGETSF